MKKLQLSHSANNKFQECGHKYNNHYNLKLRSKWYSNNFAFGSAIDEALNYMLLHFKDEDVLEESQDIFDDEYSEGFVNYKKVDFKTFEWMKYGAKDLDGDLLDEDELEELEGIAKELKFKSSPNEVLDRIIQKTKVSYAKGLRGLEILKKLTLNERKFYNACFWCSCRHKGFILLETYYKNIIPKIKKVHSVQKKILLKNEDGDSLIGYIDAVVEFKGVKGIHVMDNKTSSIEYLETSVKTSAQLATYCYMEELDQGAYAVVKKQINKIKVRTCKRCGAITDNNRVKKCDSEIDGKRCNGEFHVQIDFEGETQLIIDEIPFEVQEMVMDSLDQSLVRIAKNQFFRNLQGCDTKFGKCEYYDKCWFGKSDKECDLEIVKSKKQKPKDEKS